jgi:hypothetical protein
MNGQTQMYQEKVARRLLTLLSGSKFEHPTVDNLINYNG